MALHGAASATDWEEIQDAALDDLEQAAAFGALAGELGYASFATASPQPAGSHGSGKEEQEEGLAAPPSEIPSGQPALPTMKDGASGRAAQLATKDGAANPLARCKCPTCGKIFSRQSLLNRHLKLHAGIKPYLCNVRLIFLSS